MTILFLLNATRLIGYAGTGAGDGPTTRIPAREPRRGPNTRRLESALRNARSELKESGTQDEAGEA